MSTYTNLYMERTVFGQLLVYFIFEPETLGLPHGSRSDRSTVLPTAPGVLQAYEIFYLKTMIEELIIIYKNREEKGSIRKILSIW